MPFTNTNPEQTSYSLVNDTDTTELPILKYVFVGTVNDNHVKIIEHIVMNTAKKRFSFAEGVPDYKQTKTILNGKELTLQLWDTNNMVNAETIVSNYLKDADVVFFVVDITKQNKFDEGAFRAQEIAKCLDNSGDPNTKNIIRILIGQLGNNDEEFVDQDSITELHDNLTCLTYRTVNPYTGNGIQDAISFANIAAGPTVLAKYPALPLVGNSDNKLSYSLFDGLFAVTPENATDESLTDSAPLFRYVFVGVNELDKKNIVGYVNGTLITETSYGFSSYEAKKNAYFNGRPIQVEFWDLYASKELSLANPDSRMAIFFMIDLTSINEFNKGKKLASTVKNSIRSDIPVAMIGKCQNGQKNVVTDIDVRMLQKNLEASKLDKINIETGIGIGEAINGMNLRVEMLFPDGIEQQSKNKINAEAVNNSVENVCKCVFLGIENDSRKDIMRHIGKNGQNGNTVDYRLTTVSVGDKSVKLSVSDTCGKLNLNEANKVVLQTAQLVFVAIDLTSIESVKSVSAQINRIKLDDSVIKILVGYYGDENKIVFDEDKIEEAKMSFGSEHFCKVNFRFGVGVADMLQLAASSFMEKQSDTQRFIPTCIS